MHVFSTMPEKRSEKTQKQIFHFITCTLWIFYQDHATLWKLVSGKFTDLDSKCKKGRLQGEAHTNHSISNRRFPNRNQWSIPGPNRERCTLYLPQEIHYPCNSANGKQSPWALQFKTTPPDFLLFHKITFLSFVGLAHGFPIACLSWTAVFFFRNKPMFAGKVTFIFKVNILKYRQL